MNNTTITTNNTIKGEETMNTNTTTTTNTQGENTTMTTNDFNEVSINTIKEAVKTLRTDLETRNFGTRKRRALESKMGVLEETLVFVNKQYAEMAEVQALEEVEGAETSELTAQEKGADTEYRQALLISMHDEIVAALTKGLEDATAAVDESSAAAKQIKGEKKPMVNKRFYINKKGEPRKDVLNSLEMTVFDKASCDFMEGSHPYINEKLEQLATSARPFSAYVGEGLDYFIVDNMAKQFVTVKGLTQGYIPFASTRGKEVIKFLMVTVPQAYHAFMKSDEYHAMAKMNLLGSINAKASKGNVRDQFVISGVENKDVYVVKNNVVFGRLDKLNNELVEKEIVIVKTKTKNGKKLKTPKVTLRKGITFASFKDTDIENLNEGNSLFKKVSGSLALERTAKAKGLTVDEYEINKTVFVGGKEMQIKDKMEAILMEDTLSIDGSSSLGLKEAITSCFLKGYFKKLTVFSHKTGIIEKGTKVNEANAYMTFYGAKKSMSQARKNGAMAVRSLEQMAQFLMANGHDILSYAKPVKGSDTMYEIDVNKAYKRFMVGASDGKAPKRGFLSRFGTDVKVTVEPLINLNTGELVEGSNPKCGKKYTITNREGDTFTFAIIDDFFSIIPEGQRFLLNVLDKGYAFKKIEEFKFWKNESATEKLRKRLLSDGGGFVHSRIVNELLAAGVLNSFDAFQLRISNAVKGAVICFDKFCELYGVDMVLTDGMVKSEDVIADIERNGFQMYVVGQRKDGKDGVWVSSQALLNTGLTHAELKLLVDNTIDVVATAVEKQNAAMLLSVLDAAEEEEENELEVIDFLRLAVEKGEIMDEQYMKDTVASTVIKKLNKLLDCKVYIETGRSRYMFSDPIAMYNAAARGSFEVTEADAKDSLQKGQIVCPSTKEDGTRFMQTGKAVSNRFPITISHEMPVLEAVECEAYREQVEAGYWQGCVFYDIFTWAVEMQAGADHDGDAALIIFDAIYVGAVLRLQQKLFGGLPMLPMIDGWVRYEDFNEETGEGINALEFDKGCPDYESEDIEKKEVKKDIIKGFEVEGYKIRFNKEEVMDNEERYHDLVLLQAELAQEITIETIESGKIGIIANRAMILMDLLGRNVLSPKEREQVEFDIMFLTALGRWELDRPKHGGAYESMPEVETFLEIFEAVTFEDEEVMYMSNEDKVRRLVNVKGMYAHIFAPVFVKNARTGEDAVDAYGNKIILSFAVTKPQWLASQRDEIGRTHEGSESIFELTYAYAENALKQTCEEFHANHSKNAMVNNLIVTVEDNMTISGDKLKAARTAVGIVYNAFNNKEQLRKDLEFDFVELAMKELQKKDSRLEKKDLDSMTTAKKKAKVREAYPAKMTQFKNNREVYELELRKAMYQIAKGMKVDIRDIVGALYLEMLSKQTAPKAEWSTDGREYRFSASTGNLSVVYETLKEEMHSLLCGPVAETLFVPSNIDFINVESNLLNVDVLAAAPAAASAAPQNAIKLKALEANEALAGGTARNRQLNVAVKFVQKGEELVKVMYVLKKGVTVADEHSFTAQDVAYWGYAPANASTGVYAITASSISFSEVVGGKQTATLVLA